MSIRLSVYLSLLLSIYLSIYVSLPPFDYQYVLYVFFWSLLEVNKEIQSLWWKVEKKKQDNPNLINLLKIDMALN